MPCIIALQGIVCYCLRKVKAEKVGFCCLVKSQRLQPLEFWSWDVDGAYWGRQLFVHPKIATWPLLCHGMAGVVSQAQGVRGTDGGRGTSFGDRVGQLEGVGPCLKWLLPHSRGHFKCLLSYSRLRM